MKNLHIRVEDDEYKRLKEAKGDRTWREALFEEFGVEQQ